MELCKHCNKEHSNRKTDHYRACQDYQNFLTNCKDICTKEFLEQEYLINMKSLKTISAELGLDKTRLVLAKIKEYDIPQRTLQEALKNPTRQELTRKVSREKYGVEHHLMNKDVIQKRETTNIEKYGVNNVFQSTIIKQKSKETCLEKYGVEYSLQSEIIKNKVIQTNIERYGVDNPWKNEKIINKCIKSKYENNSLTEYYSKSSQILFWKIYNNLPKELQDKCYFAELNKEFCKYVDKPYMFDFVISSIKYCLEYNGNYYHANPSMYESTWVNKKLDMTAQQLWERDERKYRIIKNFGFHLDVVWENENIDSAVQRITESILFIQQTHKDIVNESDQG